MKPQPVRDYQELHDALRARAEALGASYETLDRIAGLPDRYVNKLLAPVPVKGIGRKSLGPLLGALGVMMLLVEDTEALERISRRLTKSSRNRNDASGGMLTVQKHKRRRYQLKGCSEWGRMMRARQTLMMTERERSMRARKAARVRWSKARSSASIP